MTGRLSLSDQLIRPLNTVPAGQACLKHDQEVKGVDISDEPVQIAFMKKDKEIIQPFGTDDTMVSILNNRGVIHEYKQ